MEVGEPTVHLALVKTVGSAEARQPPRLPIDPRELGDPADQLEGQVPASRELVIEGGGPGRALLNGGPAVDELHEIETAADDRRVITAGDSPGVGHVGVGQGGQQPVFAHHGLVATVRDDVGRAPQGHREASPCDLEELVGGTAGDETTGDRLAATCDPLFVHPPSKSGHVEFAVNVLVVGRAHQFPTSFSNASANAAYFFFAAANRVGRCWLGQRPSTGW